MNTKNTLIGLLLATMLAMTFVPSTSAGYAILDTCSEPYGSDYDGDGVCDADDPDDDNDGAPDCGDPHPRSFNYQDTIHYKLFGCADETYCNVEFVENNLFAKLCSSLGNDLTLA